MWALVAVEQGLLFSSCGAGASLVVEHGPESMQASVAVAHGLVAPQLVGSS